jgi:hypothetical protein
MLSLQPEINGVKITNIEKFFELTICNFTHQADNRIVGVNMVKRK